MSVLDSTVVIALLLDEPGADEAEALLRGSEGPPSIPSTGIAEIVDVIVKRAGRRVEVCLELVDTLVAAGLAEVPVDAEIGRQAGLLRARHWDRDRRPVSLADCIVLATGMVQHEPIATADGALVAAARAEGHPVIVLPDSSGRRRA